MHQQPGCYADKPTVQPGSYVGVLDSLFCYCRYTHYISKLPDSREAFDERLVQFYSQHGAVLAPPTIQQTPLDLYTIFNAVAQKGGYEAVSGTR